MTHRFNALREVVGRVLLEAVTVPARPYYVNYDVRVVIGRDKSYLYKYHVGPYPKLLAEFLLEHWVPTQLHRGKDYYKEYIASKTLCLKPKKGSIEGPAPTKAEIEHLLMSTLVEPLEVYRELLTLRETENEVR
jgi:hypothetical protein